MKTNPTPNASTTTTEGPSSTLVHFKTREDAEKYAPYKFGQVVILRPNSQAPKTFILGAPVTVVGSTTVSLKVVPLDTPSHLITQRTRFVPKRFVLFLSTTGYLDDIGRLLNYYNAATKVTNQQEIALKEMHDTLQDNRKKLLATLIADSKLSETPVRWWPLKSAAVAAPPRTVAVVAAAATAQVAINYHDARNWY